MLTSFLQLPDSKFWFGKSRLSVCLCKVAFLFLALFLLVTVLQLGPYTLVQHENLCQYRLLIPALAF